MHDVLALGQVVELDQAGVQPLVVRVLGGELALDLVVLDDAVLVGVDEEHPAGLEPALADDGRRVDVEHADLGGEHDEAVVGDPVAAGPQAVAVEDRADLGAVGEDDAGRAVPRLHQRGVELVERAALPGPSRRGSPTPPGSSSAPRAAASGRPGAAARAPRRSDAESLAPGVQIGKSRSRSPGIRSLASSASRARIQLRLPMHGVDLAVVGDEPVRVRQRPARERVGGEPRVHDGHRGLDPLVGEVGEERSSWSVVSMPL